MHVSLTSNILTKIVFFKYLKIFHKFSAENTINLYAIFLHFSARHFSIKNIPKKTSRADKSRYLPRGENSYSFILHS